MGDGKLNLFGPFLPQAGHIVDVFVGPGQKVLAVTVTPNGLSIVNPLLGTHGTVYPIGEAMRPKLGAAALVSGGFTWMIYEKTEPGPQPGGTVVERGVVKATVTASGELQFAQVGPTYDPALFVPEALAVAGDGSLWVALGNTAPKGYWRVDRIWKPKPIGKPPAFPDSVRLPPPWVPYLITKGESGPTHDPGFLYLLGRFENRDEWFLGCVWLTPPNWPRTFPTLRGYQVSSLATLPLGVEGRELMRAADGSAWAIGHKGSTGWIAHHNTSGQTSLWKDSKHEYQALVDGPEHTNPDGNKYRAMFLARRFVDAESDDQSDIETFRDDPENGVGWITAPDSHIVASGTVQPKITIEGLSPRSDGQGNYWFGYIAEGEPGNVYGTGYFEPPKGDPLDPP